LDRKKPEAIVTSHDVGALVSGNIKLGGTLYDGNGIASFSYSSNEGEKYIPAKFNVNKAGKGTWEIALNTKQFEDGPIVLWFKTVDGNESIGTAAHLLFINNTGPDVKVVYPEPDTVINGVFNIAGYAKHPVGLKSLSWKAGNSQGEIELLPGNQWWSAAVDARAFKGNSIDVEIRAVDVSGNVTVSKQKYKFDPASDLPVVTLTLPITGVLNSDIGLVVKGNATDDDGIASVFYSLDGAPAKEIPANGYFQFYIPTPDPGTHSLDVWAKDTTGVTGNKVSVKGIVVTGSFIQPGIASVTYPSGKNNKTDVFYTGMSIKPVAKMTMLLSYKAQTAPASATVTFGSSLSPTPVKLTGIKDVFTAVIPVPLNLTEGLTEILLTGTDRQGKEFTFSEFVYVTSSSGDDLPNSFTFARQSFLPDRRTISVKNGETLIGISPKQITSVNLQGSGASLLSATVDQYGRVAVTAADDGEAGPLSFRLDFADGTTYTSGQFRFMLESSGPTIAIQNANSYNWVKNAAPVSFSLASRSRLSSVEYSLDMGDTWQRILSASDISGLRTPVNTNIQRSLDLATASDGSINILIKATAESGAYSIADFSVLKDTQVPQVQAIMPISEARVNGTIRMAFKAIEIGVIQSVSYRRNASSPAREVYNDSQWDGDYSPKFFEILMDSIQMPLDNSMRFTFTDKAGNSSEISAWTFVIDQPMDIPTVQVILPQDNEVITNDFIVSGVMFDDDGLKGYQWRIDNRPWNNEGAAYGFSIPVALSTLTDNDHTVTVIAEDLYGVKSAPITRKFRVSLTEPTATMTYPLYDTVLKEGVQLTGSAFDRNGIKEVRASVDNGNTFNLIKGNFGTAAETTAWNYQFNTTILKDGPHVIFIKVLDRYDIPATYAFMINVDNTKPEIILDSPGDGSITVGNISVMGRVLDPNLKEASIELRSLDGVTIPANLRSRKLDLNSMVKENIDISGLADGQYNVAVIAVDRAGNMSRFSRNVQMARQTYRNYIEILYPLENEETSGEFNLYGYAGGTSPAGTVTIKINGSDLQTAPVDDAGYFVFNLSGEYLNTGNNAITVTSNFGGPTLVSTRPYNIVYREGGPWVTIDSFKYAEFSYDRAYLSGRAGYVLSEEDQDILANTTDKDVKAAILAKTLDYTEISFDNGRTFSKTRKALAKDVDFRYRLEDGEMPEGYHYIVIRATMKNGEHVVTRMVVQIDKTFPVIRVISPEAGSRYNEKIAYSASATDDIELTSLTYHLRIGGKAMYEVPGFLQGLYLETTIPPFMRQIAVGSGASKAMPSFPFSGGTTYMDIGFGLSFFDDNVKVQFQYGFLTPELYESLGGDPPPPKGIGVRYGGDVIAFKILASLYSFPFASIWGPDFEWLFGTVAIGANFSLFDISHKGLTPSKEPTWMSAILLQVEFPRVKIPKRKNFRTFSLFTEGQLWFVPTDVPASQYGIATVIPHIIMGLRLYIF
jgi:hypothetical protein